MKLYTHLTGLLAVTAMLFSCNPQPAGSEEENSQSNSAKAVQLKQGLRWEANPETSEGIYKMMEQVQQARTLPESSRCSILKDSLQNHFKYIVEKCTMTGEAHEELHNYIVPLRDLIGKLEDNSHCQATIGEIERHLQTYNHYFQ